jgi:hypothetical protein
MYSVQAISVILSRVGYIWPKIFPPNWSYTEFEFRILLNLVEALSHCLFIYKCVFIFMIFLQTIFARVRKNDVQ